MIKDLKEKKEIEISIRRTMCDVCGELVADGANKVRLYVKREAVNWDDRPMGDSPSSEPMDICSPDCLEKNINGVLMVLRSKTIPTLENGEAKAGRIYIDMSSKAEAPSTPFTVGSMARSIKLGC